MDDGRAPCPVEGCDARLPRAGTSCRTHINRVHGELPVRERSDLFQAWKERYKDELPLADPDDGFKCAHCPRIFRNRGILIMHERACKQGRHSRSAIKPSDLVGVR